VRLKQIDNFIAVLETGSIRAAARKLHVSQPAVTKSVRELEVELHAQLLRRTPHGVVPTAAGRAFFTRVRVAQTEIRKAGEEVARLGGEKSGSISLGSGPVGMLLIVPDAVADFRRECPLIHIRILEAFSTTFLPMVRDGTLDLAIGTRTTGTLDSALRFRPLFRNDFVVAARKGHPLRSARSLAELANADWIVPMAGGGRLEQAFSSAGLPFPRRVIDCESYGAIVNLLAKTDMLAITSHRLVAGSFASGLLQPITVSERMPSYTVGLFTRMDPPLTSAAATMAKTIASLARGLARAT